MIRGNQAKILLFVFPLLLIGTGCDVEVSESAAIADLEVSWSIEGSTSPVYCTDFAIDGWLVEVRGPDDVDLFIDCRDDWTTFSDLYGLLEGFYSVRVSALDFDGFVITDLSSSIDLFDQGFIEVLDFQFFESDFF